MRGSVLSSSLHCCGDFRQGSPKAIERVREEGFEIAAVTSVLDRMAGGAEAIQAAAGAPYRPLATIDDVYPERS